MGEVDEGLWSSFIHFTFASGLPWAPRSECGQDVTVTLVVQPFGLSHRSQAQPGPGASCPVLLPPGGAHR